MKKLVFTLLIVLLALSSYAQNSIRRVYMWDVTLSMTGKAGCPDIWQDVKDALVKEINLITDPSVEIVVIPFQHRALNEHMQREYATAEGKAKLVSFIKGYQLPRTWTGNAVSGCEDMAKGKTTMTALYAPLKYCLDNVVVPDKTNFLEFMTDGVSDFENDKNRFEELVRNWCSMAEEKNLYAFYVMLTPQAKNDYLKKVNQCDRLKMVDPTEGPVVISLQELTPPERISFSTHDDYGKPFRLKLSSSTSAPLKKGYKVRVSSTENPCLHVDQVCEVKTSDMSISFTPVFKVSADEIRALKNSGNMPPVVLNISPSEDMKDNLDHALVFMQAGAHTMVDVIAAAEKKVTLRWE
jgi:hypothetical protein